MFDPAAAQASEIDSIFTANGPAPSVLLLAGGDARRGGWCAQAAIALADRCGARGRCILIDLVVDGGELHDLLSADNTEGIADVFLFGASLRHVLQKPNGHKFEFVPSGAPSDTASVLENPRWARLLGEQERDGVTILLYAAANAPGLEVLSRRVRAAVALAADQELPSISSRVAEPVKKAVIAPPATATVTKKPSPDQQERDKLTNEQFEAVKVPRNASRDALIADLRARQRAAVAPPPPAPVEPVPEAPPAHLPVPVERRAHTPRPHPAPSIAEPTFLAEWARPKVRDSRLFYYWLVSLGVLVAIAFGLWLILHDTLPDDASAITAESTGESSGTPAATRGGAQGTPLLFSVAIEAHQQLPVAFERVQALREEEPQMSFYVTPVESNGVLFYHVMAGPVADSASAGALLLRLLEKGHKTGVLRDDIRRAQLAFQLGEYGTRAAANTRVAEAAELGIPGYVIEVPRGAGVTRYRVYAGSYASEAEAGVMKQLLVNVGLRDSLVRRVGKQR